MSSREALRAFQARLAARLQEAQASGVAASWLAVEAGATRLLLPLSHAGEIFAHRAWHRVPYSKDWFLGVVNLRGGLLGVVDLAGFLDLAHSGQRDAAGLTASRLVSLNPLFEMHCALLVDRLLGLRTVGAFVRSRPAQDGTPSYFGPVFTDGQGLDWQEINLQTLSQLPAFLSIGV